MSDQVADRIALQDVMLRYAAGVDERDFDLYASCFIEDVEILDFGEEPINGRDNWVEYVKGCSFKLWSHSTYAWTSACLN